MLIQVDTPPDFRTQCLREAMVRLDAVIYTHSHTDHILGFDDLRRFCEMEDKTMPIYGSARTLEDLRRVFQYAFSEEFSYRNYIRPAPVVIDGPFQLGETEIITVALPHGRMSTTGLIFCRGGKKRLAYFTDCQAVPDDVIEIVKGVDTLVIDALRHADHPTHLSLSGACAVSERVAPRQTYFTHMCHDLGHAETEASLPSNIRLAYDGLRIRI